VEIIEMPGRKKSKKKPIEQYDHKQESESIIRLWDGLPGRGISGEETKEADPSKPSPKSLAAHLSKPL
jgi:hypothetical protein